MKEGSKQYLSAHVFVYWRFYLRVRIGHKNFSISECRTDCLQRSKKLKVNVPDRRVPKEGCYAKENGLGTVVSTWRENRS